MYAGPFAQELNGRVPVATRMPGSDQIEGLQTSRATPFQVHIVAVQQPQPEFPGVGPGMLSAFDSVPDREIRGFLSRFSQGGEQQVDLSLPLAAPFMVSEPTPHWEVVEELPSAGDSPLSPRRVDMVARGDVSILIPDGSENPDVNPSDVSFLVDLDSGCNILAEESFIFQIFELPPEGIEIKTRSGSNIPAWFGYRGMSANLESVSEIEEQVRDGRHIPVGNLEGSVMIESRSKKGFRLVSLNLDGLADVTCLPVMKVIFSQPHL